MRSVGEKGGFGMYDDARSVGGYQIERCESRSVEQGSAKEKFRQSQCHGLALFLSLSFSSGVPSLPGRDDAAIECAEVGRGNYSQETQANRTTYSRQTDFPSSGRSMLCSSARLRCNHHHSDVEDSCKPFFAPRTSAFASAFRTRADYLASSLLTRIVPLLLRLRQASLMLPCQTSGQRCRRRERASADERVMLARSCPFGEHDHLVSEVGYLSQLVCVSDNSDSGGLAGIPTDSIMASTFAITKCLSFPIS